MNFQTNKVFFTTMECKSHYHIGPEKLVVQVVLCEIDCVIFYTNLHKLSCRTVKTIVEQTGLNSGQLLNIMSSYC